MSTHTDITPLFLGEVDAREELTVTIDGTRHEIRLLADNVLVTYGHIDSRTFKQRALALLADLDMENTEAIRKDLRPVPMWALVGVDDNRQTVVRWRDERGVQSGDRAPLVTPATQDAQPVTFAAIWI